jgi:hypothetical protein
MCNEKPYPMHRALTIVFNVKDGKGLYKLKISIMLFLVQPYFPPSLVSFFNNLII